MSRSLARLPANDSEPDETRDRRREPRQAVWATASLQSSRGEHEEASLVDLSVHGCAVQTGATWLRCGGFVSIALGEGPALTAIVRWTREGIAGMEFLAPVPRQHAEWHDLINGPAA